MSLDPENMPKEFLPKTETLEQKQERERMEELMKVLYEQIEQIEEERSKELKVMEKRALAAEEELKRLRSGPTQSKDKARKEKTCKNVL